MNRTVKTFLVWLLMLVLPLHAVAANVGMSCAPAGRQAVHAGAEAPMAHHADAADAHAHHGGAHASGDAVHATQDGDPSAKDLGKNAHTSCSACSALCIGAVAPPSAFLPLPSFDGSDVVAVTPVPFAAGFIPDGLQRPPRNPCA